MEFYKLLVTISNDERLEYTDMHVMAVLVTLAQYPEQCVEEKTVEISAAEIHDKFRRLPVVTVKRCLQRLSDLNYIETIKQPAPKKNRYRILIDIPQVKAQDKQIYHKKNSNKLQSDDEYIEDIKRVALANPFLN